MRPYEGRISLRPGLVLTLTSQQQGTSPQPLHKCCQLWTW